MKTILWPSIHPTDPPSTGFVVIADPNDRNEQAFMAELRDLPLALRATEASQVEKGTNGRVSMVTIKDFISELYHKDKNQAEALCRAAFNSLTPTEEQLKWGFYVRFYWW